MKRIKGLYWPYVKWGVVFVLLHNVFFSVGIYNDTSDFKGVIIQPYDTMETGKMLLSVLTMHRTERLLGGYWFLKAMFFGSLIFFTTRLIIKKTWYGATVLLIITLITSYYDLIIPYLIIGSLDFFSAFFIMVGYAMKNTNWKGGLLMERIIKCWPLIAFFALSVVIGAVYWYTSMLSYKWYHILPYTVTAIFGSIIMFAVGRWISNWQESTANIMAKYISKTKNFLFYTGEKTLVILTWHFLAFKVASLLLIYALNLPWERLGDFPAMKDIAPAGFWVLFSIVGVSCPLLGIYVYDKIRNKIKCSCF